MRKLNRLTCHECGKPVSTEFTPEPTDTPDRGLIVRALIECPECMEARFKAYEERNAEVQRLRDEVQRLRDEVARLGKEKRKQFEDLHAIRAAADRATGIDRSRGDDRDPGALGAVQELVRRYDALQARVSRLEQSLNVFTEPYETSH